MIQNTDRPDMQSTLKSMDTEEFIDIYFYRPLGYRWALLFRRLGVKPNTVTVAGIVLGVMAGVCFYFPSLTINAVGMFLLVWANTYDSADGQLARMTNAQSALGRMLDGLCGELWFISIYMAIALRLTPEWGVWIWVLAAVTGFCHSKQAAMADYYRNLHLHFLKGKALSELSRSATLEHEYRQISWRERFFLKLASSIYLNYTKGQERQTPHLQRMLAVIRDRHADEAPEWFLKDFRLSSLPLMKYANILSFNARAIALFVGLFAGYPWLYFVFELTALNVILIYMVTVHEKFSTIFAARLNE